MRHEVQTRQLTSCATFGGVTEAIASIEPFVTVVIFGGNVAVNRSRSCCGPDFRVGMIFIIVAEAKEGSEPWV
jgi:hypothetical protein